MRFYSRSRLAYSYGCIMVQIPEPLASRIRRISADIPDHYIYDDGTGEMGREDKPHVTVKYGIHTSNTKDIARVVGGFGPVRARLQGMSAFENDNIVVKWDIVSRDLHRLNSLICSELDYTDKYPKYIPHATLAYLISEPKSGYHEIFYTDELDGEEFEVSKLRFTTPSDDEYWISLVDGTVTGEDGIEKFARELRRIARDIKSGVV